MTQFHFLVMYDTKTGQWTRDDETLSVMVAGGPIYDEALEDWREPENAEEESMDAALAKELDERLN